MPINHEDINESFRRITLAGRLDAAGTDQIATRFAALSTAPQRRVLVDISGISFLASIGIRALLSSAKACQQKGGRMVLFVGENPTVAATLLSSGIDTLIPMFGDLAEAERAALA